MGAKIVEIDRHLPTVAGPVLDVKDGGIGQRGEWGFDHLGHLIGVGLDSDWAFAQPADNWGDEKVADGGEDGFELAEDGDAFGGDAQLLVGFAERGGGNGGVGGVARATREGDFAAMGAQSWGATGEE